MHDVGERQSVSGTIEQAAEASEAIELDAAMAPVEVVMVIKVQGAKCKVWRMDVGPCKRGSDPPSIQGRAARPRPTPAPAASSHKKNGAG